MPKLVKLDGEHELVEMVADINKWQFRTREAWATAAWFLPEGCGGLSDTCDTLVILNECNCSTVIPTYWIYDDMWRKAGFENPLEAQFDFVSGVLYVDLDYLSFIGRSINEQIIIYGADADTRESVVFSHLHDFGQVLDLFYEYSVRHLEKQRFESALRLCGLTI